MKIVFAFDSFKGSLSACEACQIAGETTRKFAPMIETVSKPMADGGEGSAELIASAQQGEWISVTTLGPLPTMRVKSGFAWLPKSRTAIVEMAASSGLPLLKPHQRSPLLTTTYGTGELLAAAIAHGAKKICLAIGGSATVDGGVGAAMALGWQFLQTDGKPIAPGGGSLKQIHRIIPPQKNFPEIDVWCDVTNPLLGANGAAAVFAPQKGATPEMVAELEANLSHLAICIKEQLGKDVTDIPGAGAAGGLGAGAMAFFDGKLTSGVKAIIKLIELEKDLAGADWIITGEGRYDSQSTGGKVVSGIVDCARRSGTKVAVFAGQAVLEEDGSKKTDGIETIRTLMQPGISETSAQTNAPRLLSERIKEWLIEMAGISLL